MDRSDTITSRGTVRLERSAKRVRVQLGGHVIADTTRAMLVWEKPYYPTYYIPLDDIDPTLLSPSGETRHSPSRGDATLFTVKVPGREAADAAARYEDSPITELRDLIRFDWDAMDAWYEEDEPVYVHPRDPHTRVDILASSRPSESSSPASRSPTHRGRGCSSRPGCQPGTTCRAPTYGWTC